MCYQCLPECVHTNPETHRVNSPPFQIYAAPGHDAHKKEEGGQPARGPNTLIWREKMAGKYGSTLVPDSRQNLGLLAQPPAPPPLFYSLLLTLLQAWGQKPGNVGEHAGKPGGHIQGTTACCFLERLLILTILPCPRAGHQPVPHLVCHRYARHRRADGSPRPRRILADHRCSD